MATKVLEVHLVGEGVSLDRAFASSAKSATAAAGTIEAAGTRIVASGKKVQAVGKTWNRTLTLPLLAMGGAAVVLSRQFGGSMRLISTQAGASRKEMERMKTSVLGLVSDGRVKQSPNELAEALFHIESVGFRGAKALHTLKAAADLSAVGQSNLETTTYALVSAMETGIKGTSTLKETIGMLNAIVGTGDMKMEDLTAALSSGVLVSAKQVGLSLQDVGAALDMLTARGVPATVSATRLRMTFTLMAAPTEKAKKALKSIGLDSEALAKKMQGPTGLVGALELLQSHLHGLTKIEQTQLLSEAFGGAKSGTTMMGLLQNLSDVKERFDQLGKSTGNFDEKLKEVRETPGFKLDVGLHQLETTLIKLGDHLMPVIVPAFQEIVGVVTSLGDKFTGLSTGTQGWIVKIGIATAAMGPLITIGGKLITIYGKLFELTGMIVASNVVGELGAGLRLAMAGEAGGLLMVGGDLAKTLMRGIAMKLGPLAAVAGLADIIYHAVKGDFKSVGFEIGGALVGGIAGFFLGGPAGAALGAGLGAFGGDLVKSLFGDGGDAMSAFQKQTQEVIKHAVAGRRVFARSSSLVVDAEKRLEDIGKRQARVADRLKNAQERLNNARKNGNLPTVRREEAKVNELKAKQIALTHRQWNAETLLHSAKVKNEQDARRIRTTEVALTRTREVQFEQAKKHERQAQREFEQAVRQQKPLKEINEKEKDLIKAQQRRKGSSEKLKAAEKELGGTMKEITDKFGKKFADQLREQIPLWKSTANQMKRGEQAVHRLVPGYSSLNESISRYKTRQKEARAQTEAATGPLYKLGNRAKETGQKIQHAKTEVVGGFTGMEVKGTSFLQALKVQSPFNVPAKASGGYIVKGQGLHDTVPVTHSDIAAMVAPGEMLAVINRHQAPLLSQAVTNEWGVDGLSGFFNTFNKPHYMATGGLIEPKIQTGGVFRKGEQKEIHQGFKALNKYLQEHSEPKRVHAMLEFAQREARQGYPYVYGGGHGSFSGPYDCSGYVSAILHAGNFLSTPMSVQRGSGLYTLGEAGPGKWFTWGVRGSSGANAHTMIAIKKPGNQGWGYFEAGGSGGGAHEDSGWDGSFEFRHIPGYTKGGIVPDPVKKTLQRYGTEATDPHSPHFVGWGYNQGGIVRKPQTYTLGGVVPRFSTGGPVPPKGGELVGASYYGGPTDNVSGTTGAAGVSLPGTMSFAELAMGTALGGLAMHTKLEFSRSGKSLVAEKLDVGSGGDPVAGHNRAVDFWYEAGAKLGIGPSNGVGVVRVKPASGAVTAGAKKAEVVPGMFMGAKTRSISFPSVPKNLPAIKREINRWQGEAAKYRRAINASKDKPKTQHALQANLTKIENYLRQLYTARSKVRFEKAKKKLHTKIAKQLGKLTGKETEIKKIERAYNEADETASQTVDLEPQAPRTKEALNPDDANEVKRVEEENKKAEEDYIKGYQEYVDHQERSAYEKVLFIEANWRNKIIEAERFATGLEQQWETKSRTARVRIEGINRYTDKVNNYVDKVKGDIDAWKAKRKAKKLSTDPKDYPDWLKQEIGQRDLMVEIRNRERAKLPMLRERDRSFSAILGEGREHFYGGTQWIPAAKDFKPPNEAAYPGTGAPLNPPKPPLAGTGSLEEELSNVQGQHWPEQHAYIEPLPAKRVAGRFGGVIWDTQTAIEELGLKIAEAAGGGGGGGGASAADELGSEKLQLTEEALLRERQARASLEATAATMGSLGQIGPKDLKATFPWAGRYAKGGPVMAMFGENGPELGLVPEGTNVATADKTERLLKPHIEVNNHIYPDGRVDTDVVYNGEQMEAVVNNVAATLGSRANHRAQSPGNGRVGTL